MVLQHAHHGEQYHHSHPSLLTDQLYLAAARAISSRVLLDLGITCIINATLELPTLAYQQQDCLQVAVEDHVASKLYVYFDLVADKIKAVHDSGAGKAMIYCRAGMSRSASLCIAYFIKYHDMSLDDAFQYVKKRRPIIQPNVGFMRQLREYEQKVRKAKADAANNNSNGNSNNSNLPRTPSWKRRQREIKLPALMFAECCSSDDDETLYDDYYSIKIIKPRPVAKKPRVSLCEESLDLPAQAYDAGALMEDCTELLPSPELEVTIATENVQQQQQQPQQPQQHQSESYFSTIVIAEVHCPTTLETKGATTTSDEEQQPVHRTPFSKISEPARIAVSCLQSLLEMMMALRSDRDDDEERQHSRLSFSVFPEQLCQLPQVSSTLPFECAAQAVKPSTSPSTSSSSPSAAVVNPREKATAVVSLLSSSIIFYEAFLSEEEGAFERQEISPLLQQLEQASHPARAIPEQPKPLPSAPKEKRKLLQRTKSIRLPGLRISPLPEKTKLREPTEEKDANYLEVPTCGHPPLAFLDDASEDSSISPLRFQEVTPKVEPLDTCRCYCAHRETDLGLFEMVLRDPYVSRSRPELLPSAVARKTAIVCTATLAVTGTASLSSETVMPSEMLMPTRKYPYYSIVKGGQEEEPLCRATEGASVESCWFFAIPPKRATKTVCLMPRKCATGASVASTSATVRKIATKHGAHWRDPPVSWAAERYYIDLASVPVTTKPMEETEYCSAAPGEEEDSLTGAADVLDLAKFPAFGVIRITRFEPQSYSSFSVANMCCFPLFSCVDACSEEVFVMENLFCQPTVVKSVAARSFHADDQVVALGLGQSAHFHDESQHLEAIPESMGTDLSELKRRLLLLKDSVKIAIWLDVFKRNVIKSRPIYAKVAFQELLSTAETTNQMQEIEVEEGFDQNGATEERKGQIKVIYEESHNAIEIRDSETAEFMDDHFDDCFFSGNGQASFHIHANYCLTASWTCQDVSMEYYFIMGSAGGRLDLPTRIFPKLGEPLRQVASSGACHVLGLECKRSHLPLEWMFRKPFKTLAGPRNVSTTSSHFQLVATNELPPFQYVDGPEQGASLALSDAGGGEESLDQVSTVDVLYYFEASPEEMRDFTASPPPESGASSGSYKLFLPDPSLMDKLGKDTSQFKADDGVVLASPPARLAETLSSSSAVANRSSANARSSRPLLPSNKRVSFREDTPPTPEDTTLLTRRRNSRKALPSSFVSYQTPLSFSPSSSSSRARSSSRKRVAVAEESRSDRQAMASLKTSVQRASDLLERRRRLGEEEDGEERTTTPAAAIAGEGQRNRRLSPTHQMLAEAGGVAVRGLLGMVQQVVADGPSSMSRSALRKAARERSVARRSGRM